MAYNYDLVTFASQNLEDGKDQKLLWDMSSLVSAVLFNVENLQGVLADNDLLSAQFNCVNEGVVMLNAELVITKMNKSAEILLNTASSVAVGKRISEIIGASNNQLMKPITE
jgi:sensor histidine kinase regulating citrate/malate metabolism